MLRQSGFPRQRDPIGTGYELIDAGMDVATVCFSFPMTLMVIPPVCRRKEKHLMLTNLFAAGTKSYYRSLYCFSFFLRSALGLPIPATFVRGRCLGVLRDTGSGAAGLGGWGRKSITFACRRSASRCPVSGTIEKKNPSSWAGFTYLFFFFFKKKMYVISCC